MSLRRRLLSPRVAGWAAASALGAVAAIWASPTTSQPILVGVQGTAVWLLTPAYPLALGALWRGRFALGVSAALLCVCHVVCLAMNAGQTNENAGSGRQGDEQLRVVTSNVLLDNARMVEALEKLAALDADLLLLQEITPGHVEYLRSSPLWSTYPYRLVDAREGYFGYAIFSRYPLSGAEELSVAGSPMLGAVASTPGGTLRVLNVHAVAPLSPQQAEVWKSQMKEMGQWIRKSGGPVLLAGDFNATTDHTPFRKLLASGVHDAFHAAGRGLGGTWPEWDGPTFPIMRLDHVLTTGDMRTRLVSEQAVPGSDHRSVVATLEMPGA